MNSAMNGRNCKRNCRSYNFSQGRRARRQSCEHRVRKSVFVQQAELIPAPRHLSAVQTCRPRSADRTVYRRSDQELQRGRAWVGKHMHVFANSLLHAVYYTRSMPFTNPPGRRVNLQLSSLLDTCCLGHPLLHFALPGRLPIASIGIPIAAVDCGVAVMTFAPLSTG